jgi:pyruvate dehydrogenase E2 component (dihydrolipoamide acetyltransferase)
MEEGTIVAWLVRDGEAVASGAALVEIETDKASMPYEAEAAGYLRVLAHEGETVAVGAVIAELHPEPAHVGSSGARPRPARPAGGRPARAFASPLARRVAEDMGIDLAALRGSGPGGRIVKRDVIAAGSDTNGAGASVADARGTVTRAVANGLQQLVARRMSESKATAPDFTVSLEIDMTAALDLRRELKVQLPEPDVPSINDLVIKGSALALRAHPRVNGAYTDGAFEEYERINVGVAVAVDNGLVVPVIADADRLSLGEIARRSRYLAHAVRAGTVTPAELSGATFTVSNLGMYGVSAFSAVINPPQAAILAVAAISRRPMFDENDQVVARHLMTATLTSDHRIIYGADAASFLATLRTLLEAPLRLIV